MITKVEIIHDATDLDKSMYRWFNSKCKNDDDVPKLLIVITCYPVLIHE